MGGQQRGKRARTCGIGVFATSFVLGSDPSSSVQGAGRHVEGAYAWEIPNTCECQDYEAKELMKRHDEQTSICQEEHNSV